jgi:hypothetical protein
MINLTVSINRSPRNIDDPRPYIAKIFIPATNQEFIERGTTEGGALALAAAQWERNKQNG